ncbi:MAG: tRNA uridine(34) 5-carboxymethylaminomethyl modification radical SAM/GNAT enzyme Elp3 [Candidatus Micrarchaeota archaeon]
MNNDKLNKFVRAIALSIKSNPLQNIEKLKMKLCKKHKIPMIKNAKILSLLPSSLKSPLIIKKLSTRPTRTGSGVTPIAIMPPPFPCPGKCIYCPRGENAPQSYTGYEPATMRAIQNKYDAKKQIKMRLSQYEALGQPNEKCELIIMGGTFPAAPSKYTDKFIIQCYNAFNSKNSSSLPRAKKINEKAKHRIIGLTIETRPDWCKISHIDKMLEWGATRVELGVQTLDNKILKKVKRGHDVNETIRATADLKNSAFKVCYHFMPGLYSTHKKDVEMLKKLFTNSSFCPDMLKLYPCLVMKNTKLYAEYQAGRFHPIDTQEAVSRIADAAKYFPPWARIMRMQRDIPANNISAGVKKGNLHQLVDMELEKRGEKLRDIRSREIFSLQRTGKNVGKLNFELVERKYNASNGIEHFISFEDIEKDLLAGFIRLRFPPSSHRKEITSSTALIRELHVYGKEVSIGVDGEGGAIQHTGIGKQLLSRAEEIAQDNKKEKMLIISGVGARPYYRKFGYKLVGPYMGKKL